MDIDQLVRENIRVLKPYHSARQDYLSGVLLDANENAFGSVVNVDNVTLHRYPDPFQREIRSVLAKMNGVESENIFIGVGSDEVIDLLMRIFCEPKKDSVLVLEPTYGMYRVAASIQDVEVKSCLLTEDFQINVASVRKAIDATAKLIFCCSPNNPTANLLRREDILNLCSLGAMVVVDEAYIDFADAISLSSSVLSISNLIVMRTLSKAWGLAGIRLGYCMADTKVISYFMKVKAPYNINALTSKLAFEALQKVDEVKKTIQAIIQERTWLIKQLQELKCVIHVYPSDANFVVARCSDANVLYRFLADRNIIVRNRSTEPRLENCLRITVGTHPENELLIQAMKEYCI
jgi:histidinol-phosphate aminotransferase